MDIYPHVFVFADPIQICYKCRGILRLNESGNNFCNNCYYGMLVKTNVISTKDIHIESHKEISKARKTRHKVDNSVDKWKIQLYDKLYK